LFRVEAVDDGFKTLRKAFHSGKTFKMEWRKKQLSQLILGLQEMTDELTEALYQDLKREKFVSYLYEVAGIIGKAQFDLKHFESWAKPSKRDTPLTLAPAKSRVIYQPLGCICIMGAWNFPFTTLLSPLISAIVAGNCALLKPSEMSPHCSASSRKLVEKYLDNECFKVVEGGAEISIACSQKKWDKICFTGSSEKGKLVAQAAAKNLVPCLLELGGKCITIVDESSNARFAANKVISGRLVNSGQV
jgi:aldehyde dehydrogenase (NAD+)